MAISHINGIAVANISHRNGIAKANISAINGVTASFGGGGGGDADVAAFISATGISNSTIENALETLVTSLKADGIWTKCTAIYPFVGGDATKHSYNLKDTSSYQITWTGTITHDSNGVTGGSSHHGNTGLNASSVLSANDVHMGVYSRTSASASSIEIGCNGPNDASTYHLGTRFSNLYYCQFGPSSVVMQPASSDGSGFVLGSRRGTTDAELYRNGSSIDTDTNSNATGTMPNVNVYILANNNNGTASLRSTRNLAFATIGTGLTDTEASNYHTAVEAFQDALSRGVV